MCLLRICIITALEEMYYHVSLEEMYYHVSLEDMHYHGS